MGTGERRSRWHDEDAWVKRLQHDQELLRERIGQEQMMALGAFLTLIDRDGMADYLVVYDKAAREGIEAKTDVDFFFERKEWTLDPVT
jgi:hypothetical protein